MYQEQSKKVSFYCYLLAPDEGMTHVFADT